MSTSTCWEITRRKERGDWGYSEFFIDESLNFVTQKTNTKEAGFTSNRTDLNNITDLRSLGIIECWEEMVEAIQVGEEIGRGCC